MATTFTASTFKGLLTAGLVLAFGTARAQSVVAPDPGFGTVGSAATVFSAPIRDFSSLFGTTNTPWTHVGQVLVHNNKILVCGPTSTREWKVQRFLMDGTPDPSFGTNGTVTTASLSSGSANGLAVQPDGKIVVAGTIRAGFGDVWALARYTDQGAPDPTFGTGGVSRPADPSATPGSSLHRVVVLPNGNLLAAAVNSQSNPMYMMRFLPSGAPDNSYGSNSPFGPMIYAVFYDMMAQPDGKVVVAHTRTPNFTLGRVRVTRYTATGDPDLGFGTNGEAGLTTSHTHANGQTEPLPTFIQGMAVQPDGKLLFAGHHDGSGRVGDAPSIFRLNANGTPDASFVPAPGLGMNDGSGLHAVALQSSGRLIVAGGAEHYFPSSASGNRLLLARLEPNGALDATFSNAPGGPVAGTYTATAGTSATIRYITVLPNDQILALEGVQPASGADFNLRLTRYTAALGTGVRPAQGAALQLQAAPLPARGSLRLRYELPQAAPARLTLRDQLGRTVASQVRPAAAGTQQASLDLAACAPGIYFCTLEAGASHQTIRVAVGQ